MLLLLPSLRKLADCAQLLEVDDMVRLAVPDSKCVYTYIQELYRSLVQKGPTRCCVWPVGGALEMANVQTHCFQQN